MIQYLVLELVSTNINLKHEARFKKKSDSTFSPTYKKTSLLFVTDLPVKFLFCSLIRP